MRKRFPPPPDDLDEPCELSEDDRVRAWRETWLLELGFTVEQAVVLAHGPAERGRVEALLSQACSHRLVTAILA